MMTLSVTGHRLKVFVAKVMTCGRGASPSGGGGVGALHQGFEIFSSNCSRHKSSDSLRVVEAQEI